MPSDRELFQCFKELSAQGVSRHTAYRTLGTKYALKIDSVRGRISRERDRREDELDNRSPMYSIREDLDDTPKLDAWLGMMRRKQPYIRMLAWYDIHMPDDNAQAMALGHQVEQVVKPDLNLLGGDVFDMDALGSFGQSRRRNRRDPLREIEDNYLAFTRKLTAPALMLAGNHDGTKTGRVGRALDAGQGLFPEVEEEAWVNMCRAGGRVWYLDGAKDVKLNSIVAQHGTRTGENAATAALKDLGYGLAQISGHTHQPRMIYQKQAVPGPNAGDYRIITSAIAGMLGNLIPHYQTDTSFTKYIHSVLVVNFSLSSWVADVQQVIFHPEPNGDLVAFYGNHVLCQPKVALKLVGQRTA